MFDNYYGQQIYEVLQDIFTLLTSLSTDVEHILQAVCFFGLLFVAYNFISKRWLTLNA